MEKRRVIQMKTIKSGYTGILILTFMLIASVHAENRLTLARSANNILEIKLDNSEKIYSVQFTLNTSSNITLGKFERESLTADEDWLVASYKPNDSIVQVIIVGMQAQYFPNGNGALAKISFTCEKPNERSFASLSNVVITNSHADSVDAAISKLEWSNKSVYSSNNNDSKTFFLNQNFPNPFNPSTNITYRLQKAAHVRLSIYDITGREVNQLINQDQAAGEYTTAWNSNNRSDQKMASGMYFVRLNVDNESITNKMVLAK